MNFTTDLDTIRHNLSEYIWLRRKREFYLDGFDGVHGMMYGEGEQQDFTVLFSPDRLETQHPFYQTKIRSIKSEVCPHTDYKHEYFPLSDTKVQKSIDSVELDSIYNLSDKFVTDTSNWLYV